MPRLVVDPRSRFGFHANYNPALRMSNGAVSSIKIKLDKERAKYEKTIKVIDWHRKMELRMTQRELEEARKELTLLRAYQQVAKQTAFVNFDPVLQRRREREERQREEKEEEAALRRQREEEGEEESGEEGEREKESSLLAEEKRRMSMRGNVFVTFQDIVGTDAVLRRNSREIHQMKRRSQHTLDSDYGDEEEEDKEEKEVSPRRRERRRSSRRRSDEQRRPSMTNVIQSGEEDSVDGRVKNAEGGVTVTKDSEDGFGVGVYNNGKDLLDPETVRVRRRSRIGSLIGMVELDSIKETGAEPANNGMDNKDGVLREGDSGINTHLSVGDKDNGGNSPKRLVVHGRKGFKTGNVLNGFFLTDMNDESSHDNNNSNDNNNNSNNSHNNNNNSNNSHNNNNSNRNKSSSSKGDNKTSKKSSTSSSTTRKDVSRQDKPLTIYQLSKLYEIQKTSHMKDAQKAEMTRQKKQEQRKYESIKRRLQEEKFSNKDSDKKNKMTTSSSAVSAQQLATFITTSSNSSAPDAARRVGQLLTLTTETTTCTATDNMDNGQSLATAGTGRSSGSNSNSNKVAAQRSHTTAPGRDALPVSEGGGGGEVPAPLIASLSKQGPPLKGLARFKNVANAVSIQIQMSKGDQSKTNRLKNVAAAVVMKRNTTAGRVPKAFMLTSELIGGSPRVTGGSSKATALEAAHRNPDDCKIRPLAMPESVKAEYAERWKDLMINVNSAVQWKVRALRVDTGTLNARQIRRQQPKETLSASPRPRRAVFPGACKTTWSMKRFLSQEVEGVLKAWQPDNIRRKKNQQMKGKVTLPSFVDRVRTTTSILNSFRDYRRQTQGSGGGDDDEDEKNDNNNNNDDSSTNDDDDDNDDDV